MILHLFFCYGLITASVPFAEETRDEVVTALIYQAEVFGERDAAIDQLRHRLLKATSEDQIGQWVRAMAIVKQPLTQHQFPALMSSLVESGLPPQAVINLGGMSYLRTADFWVELGDWVGGRYVRQIEPGRIVLESPDRQQMEHLLSTPPIEMGDGSHGRCVLVNADAVSVLSFVAAQTGLNFFIHSSLERRLSGVYVFPDWLTLMDAVCRDAGIMWTRRRDNVIFRHNPTATNSEIMSGIDRRGENLADFLQQLARAFDMELVMDDELADIQVDIVLEDQPWDEVLDCLSIMNGFTWNQIRDATGRARLLIQKE